MIQELTKNFVVFISVDPENKREADRLVLMRRLVENGLGSGVIILDEVILLDYPGQSLLILVEAADQQTVATPLKACQGVYVVQIIEVSLVHFNAQISNARYCILATETATTISPILLKPATSNPSVLVRYKVTLPQGNRYSSISMVASPSFHLAKLSGIFDDPEKYSEVSNSLPLQEYFQARIMNHIEPVVVNNSANEENALVGNASNNYFIFNEGSDPVIFSQTDSPLPFTADVISKQLPVPPSINIALNSTAYLWKSFAGSFVYYFRYRRSLKDAGGFSSERETETVTVQTGTQPSLRWAYPDLVIPYSAIRDGYAVSQGFNLSDKSGMSGFHTRSDLYLWLNDLLHTTKFDLPWPESEYKDGLLAAYNYIVDHIKDKVPPNKGTIKEATTITNISFPGNGQFTKKEYLTVQQHLLTEIDHLKTVDQWFYPNGIIDSINTIISISATNSMNKAIGLMSVSAGDTQTSVNLDEMVGYAELLIGAIPEIGAPISAIIGIAWEVVKHSSDGSDPVLSGKPVGVAVAQLADFFNRYLGLVTKSTNGQLKTLYSNWGKLQEFSDGVITGKISVQQFYPGSSSKNSTVSLANSNVSSENSNGDNTTYHPKEFTDATSNAWLTICFQTLFSAWHKPTASLYFSSSIPANPWNPDAGQYAFTWTLPASYKDSKGNVVKGYAVMSCATDALIQVMQTLFGKKSTLDINPIEFFAGINGWPRVIPLYDSSSWFGPVEQAISSMVEIGF